MSGEDLAAWLSACYDEAWALADTARHGTSGEWGRRQDDQGWPTGHLRDDTDAVVVYDEGSPTDAEFDHIAACDPAHRLADIALKRAILALHHPVWNDYVDGDGMERGSYECAECEPTGTPDNWPCKTVRQLAAEFAGQPGYREEWKPE